jgi:hypothetical protein
MTLPTRPLGNSGLHITRAGFGSCAVGGGGRLFGWDPQLHEPFFTRRCGAMWNCKAYRVLRDVEGQAKRHGPPGNRLPRGAS